jgi:8-hydroxy-5-deazaflavin:NADPH oxidoreductase
VPGAHEGRVAVIGGTGHEGFGLAARWAHAGIEVVIGSRDAGRAADAAARLGDIVEGAAVSGLENSEAAGSADVVVVAVPFAGQAAIYRSIASAVTSDAVVVDCTAPLAAAVGGRPAHLLGVWQGSAAQQAAGLLDRGTLCAAFHTLSAATLTELDRDLEGDVLVCGPRVAKAAVRTLVEAIRRLRFVDAGPLDNARIVESLTALLVGINRRYKVEGSGIRITGLPG